MCSVYKDYWKFSSYNQSIQLENKQKIWTDISLKSIFRWKIRTRIKKCSVLVTIQTIKIKTARIYLYLLKTKMYIYIHTHIYICIYDNTKKNVEKLDHSHCWQIYIKWYKPSREYFCSFFLKTKYIHTIWLSNFTPGH